MGDIRDFAAPRLNIEQSISHGSRRGLRRLRRSAAGSPTELLKRAIYSHGLPPWAIWIAPLRGGFADGAAEASNLFPTAHAVGYVDCAAPRRVRQRSPVRSIYFPRLTPWAIWIASLLGGSPTKTDEHDAHFCIVIRPSLTAFSSSAVAHSTLNEPCFGLTV
jgi:hypothetical protein